MKNLDDKKLKALIAKGQIKDAASLIEQVLKSDLTPEEKGALFTNFAQLYLQMKNELDDNYLDTQEFVLEVWEKIESEQKNIEEDLKVKAARQKINGS